MHIDEFKEYFHTVTDERQSAKITYCLFEVLFGSLCAVIAGAKGWFDIREYILVPMSGLSVMACLLKKFLPMIR